MPFSQTDPQSFIPQNPPTISTFQASKFLTQVSAKPISYLRPHLYWNQFGPLLSQEKLKFPRVRTLPAFASNKPVMTLGDFSGTDLLWVAGLVVILKLVF